MTNLQVVLLKLFEPVMDASFSKIDKVDPEYYRSTKRIVISDETKIKATKEEADEFYAIESEHKYRFKLTWQTRQRQTSFRIYSFC